MSIADSVLSMRVPAPFQPLSGRISKQSSLSIHSNNPLGPSGALSGLTGEKSSVRASPVQSSVPRDCPTTLPTPIPSAYSRPAATSPLPHVARQDTKLPRQESSFTQEEIYRYLKQKICYKGHHNFAQKIRTQCLKNNFKRSHLRAKQNTYLNFPAKNYD